MEDPFRKKVDQSEFSWGLYWLRTVVLYLVLNGLPSSTPNPIRLVALFVFFLNLFWPLRTGRFPLGRVLVVVGFLVCVPLSAYYSRLPEQKRVPIPKVRAAKSFVDASHLNIAGVRPGMTRDQVRAVLGEPHGGSPAAGPVSYQERSVEIIFSEGKVQYLSGDRLLSQANVLVEVGDTRAKVVSLMGQGRRVGLSESEYGQHDPDVDFLWDSKQRVHRVGLGQRYSRP